MGGLLSYLAGEGLSTRAIAPIVGVDRKTVARDIAGGANVPPGPAPAGPEVVIHVDGATGELIDQPEPTKTTGLDGKTYTRPAPKPVVVLAGEDLARFDAVKNAKALGECLAELEGLTYPAHRAAHLTKWWPAGFDAVAPTKRDLLTPTRLRDFAAALLTFADELEEDTK